MIKLCKNGLGASLAFGAVACVLMVGVLGISAAHAAAPRGVNATQGSITCSVFSGKVKFTPPLVPTPDASQKVKVSGTVSDCTTSGVAATVSSGEVKASGIFDLTSEGPDLCNNLTDFSVFPTNAGSGTIAWTSSPSLSSGDTTYTIAPLHVPSDGNKFEIGWTFGSPGGSFQGTNHGADDSFWADGPTLSEAAAECNAAGGLKTMTLTTPSFSPLLSLG